MLLTVIVIGIPLQFSFLLNNLFLENLSDALEDISNNSGNSHFQISENPITELFFEEPIIDSNKKTEIIEKLAEYEHKKWSQEYDRIDWHSSKNIDGSRVISEDDIEQIQKYNSQMNKLRNFIKKTLGK